MWYNNPCYFAGQSAKTLKHCVATDLIWASGGIGIRARLKIVFLTD